MLIAELEMLTVSPMPVGTLFKCLSPESRSALSAQKLPLETFLLRQKQHFAVYRDRTTSFIMCARADRLPEAVHPAVEVSADAIFNGKRVDTDLRDVYTILKYVPNEWSSFISLGIPDSVKKAIMGTVQPKKWLDLYPNYFETRIQLSKAHSFDVRRSLELQRRAAKQNEGTSQQQRPK